MSIDPEAQIKEQKKNPSFRAPVVLCLETAWAKCSVPLCELIEGFRLFVSAIDASSTSIGVDFCIVTFAEEARLIANFNELNELHFERSETVTNLGAGVNLALDNLEKRKSEYLESGVDYLPPWLILLTDGPKSNVETSYIDVAERICELEAEGKLIVFPIGIGPQANMTELARFSKKHSPLNFQQFFSWLSKFVSRVSQSMPCEQVTTVDIDNLQGWGAL